MAVTRINNNQITDASTGNVYVGINAGTKIQDYSITAGKIANSLVYGSDFTITGNLTVNGQTTTIDTVSTVIEDPVIVLASNQTGTPAVDIGFIGERGDQNNIAFVWDESADEFVTAFTTDLVTNTTITISSYANFHTNDANIGGNITINGTTSLVGNISSALNVTGNVNGGNLNTAGQVVATGNVSGGNVTTAGQVVATGNITGGNLNTAGQVVATGNITGGNLIAITALVVPSINVSGNITGGNLITSGITSTGSLTASTTISATGNVSGGNVTTAGQVAATGNVSGGNVVSSALVSGTTVTATGNVSGGNVVSSALVSGATVTASGNITGGNLSAGSGIISTTGNINGANVNATSGITAGTTVTATGNVSGGNLTTAGTVSTATVTATGNINGANVNATTGITSTTITATGNITGGNISTAGTFSAASLSATGNITGGNVISNALVSGVTVTASGNVSGGNITTAGLVSAGTTITATGNVSGGNLTTSGITSTGSLTASTTINATGNITGGNLTTSGVTSTDTLTTTGNALIGGNLVVQGNITYINIDDLRVEDPIIILGTGPNGAPLTTDDGMDRGVFMEYYKTGLGNAFMGWDNSSGNMVIAASASFTGNNVVQYNEYGTLQAGNLYIQSAVSTGNVTGGNLTTSGITSTGSLTASTTINATGNITGGNLTTSGITSTGSLTASTTINATGNVSGGNVTTAGQVVATGNITGGNISTTGTLSTTGNLNGANVNATSGITAGTTIIATGNITGGNVSAGSGIISTTGNINGGNLNATTGVRAVTGYFTGNVDVLGNLNATIGVVYANSGIFYGNSITGNNAAFAGVPGFTQLGSNVVMQFAGNVNSYSQLNFQNINNGTSASTDFIATADNGSDTTYYLDLGINSSTFNDPTNYPGFGPNDSYVHNHGGNLILNPETTGKAINFMVGGTANANIIGYINASGLSVTGTIAATGNTSGGNVTTAGQVSATGNITGGNLITAGLVSAGTTVTATGNVSGGNVTTAGQVTATGNVTGGNVIATALVTGANVNATSNVTGANIVGTTSGTFANIRISTSSIDSNAARITINGADSDVDFAVDGDTVANVFYVDAGTGTASFGSATQTTNAIVAFNSTRSVLMPVGTTGERPGTGVTGMLRFNTTNDALEVYDASGWTTVGVPSFTVIADEQFNGDGSTVAFVLGSEQTTSSCIVSINGVVQIPTVAYSVSGTGTSTLTFTEAPEAGDLIDVRELTTTTTITAISNTGGNAVVAPNSTLAQVNITGDLIPTANVTYDLGNNTARWNELWLAGNTIVLGNTVIKNTSGNSIGFFGPDGTTPATIDASSVDTTQIQSGTSSMAVIASGGNIRANIAGTTVQTISTGLVAITGDLSVSGNATLSGNILGDRIVNGTTSIEIQTPSGNANISVGGTSNVAVFTTTGLTLGTGSLTVGSIENANANGVGNIGSSTTYFNTVFAKATSAQYADLAEKYVADAEYAPGTVVVFGGDKEVTVTSTDADRAVAGVVSTNPSYIMNGGLEAEHVATVALTGRVPCRVTGTIRKGDLMVSAGYGLARAEQDPRVGTVIGKALENHEGNEGVIEVVVGRF